MSEYGSQRPGQQVSGWAVGGLTFAGTVLLIIGTFQVITGLAAIIDDDFFVVGKNYAFDLDTTAWGVIELLIGAALVTTGWGLLNRSAWAGVTAIVLASFSAIANFFFIPYYPFWAILVIALDIWVIWAITRPGVLET
jgi:hypothetical protein